MKGLEMWEVITGLISGIVSGTGMGGGTILILVLSIFLGIEQHTAQATNLIFFIPTAVAAIYINIKNKKINFKVGKISILYGLIGVAIGISISKRIQVDNLRMYFGIFLLIVSIYELYCIFVRKEYYKCQNKN